MYKAELVDCKYCFRKTTMRTWRMCTRCFDLRRMIGNDPELAKKFLVELAKND